MRIIPVTNPRRRPRQARAQATVEAIIKATARVLVDEGYDHASTNRIAQAAGVSIGSLYQYFPSKESLVSALVDEHIHNMMAALTRKLDNLNQAELPEATRMMVEGLIDAYRVDQRLYHVLCEEVPKIGSLTKVYDFERQVAEINRGYLKTLGSELRTKDLDRAIFILMNAVPGIIRAAIDADTEGTGDAALTREITDLILRYLMVEPPI